MKTFSEFLNEGAFTDKVVRTAKKLFRFKVGDAYVDDKMLDVIDDADEVAFQNGEIYMYFLDAMNAQEAFKRLANMTSSEVSNTKFYGPAGIEGALEDYDFFKSLRESVVTDTKRSLKLFQQPLSKLMRDGFVKIRDKEALAIFRDKSDLVLDEIYNIVMKRDMNGHQIWLLGPREQSNVFENMAQANSKFQPNKDFTFTKIDDVNTYNFFADEKDKQWHTYIWVKNGNMSIDKWQLYDVQKINPKP